MKPQALVVILLAAILVVVGYFVLRESDDLVPANLPGGAAGAFADWPEASVDVERAAGTDPAQAKIGSEVAINRTAAPDATPTEAAAKGSMLRGRIVDLDGAPRGGLALSIDTWGSDTMVDIRPMPGGRNQVRKDVTTAADGTFRAHVGANRQGTISLSDGDLVFAKRMRFAATGDDQDLGDLVVVRSARLAGIVQDEDGKPVAGMMVAAELGAMGFDVQSVAKTGDDGTFNIGKLRSGTWLLTTKSNQYLPTSKKVEIADEQQMTDLVIVVERGRAIAGRVVDDRGVGVAGMKVASQRKSIVGGVDIQRFTTDEAAVTDESGNFRLGGLEGGTTTIRVTGPAHTTVTLPNVETDTNNVELRVERLGAIHGVLVTADGTPVVGSRVTANTQSKASGAIQLAEDVAEFEMPGPSVTTDEQGKFVLDSVKPGMVTVKARGKAHLPVAHSGVQVRAAQTVRGMRLIADAGAIARIRVVDQDGAAIVGAQVMIRPAPKAATPGFNVEMRATVDDEGGIQIGNGKLGSGVTGEDGVAVIVGLPGGEVVVSATHTDFAPSGKTHVAMPSTGAVDRQITMAPPSFVEVLVTSTGGSVSVGTDVLLEVANSDVASAGPRLGGMGSQDLVGRQTTDAEGKVRFGPVAAGDYVVSLSRGKKVRDVGGMTMFIGNEDDKISSSAKQFAVGGGKTAQVALKMPILTRLTGVVMGSDGPVAGCGVELESAADDNGIPGLGGSRERTKDDGSFTFEGVESGDYVLRYGKSDQVVKARHELTVPANTTELQQNLTLRTGTVRVLVLSKDDAEPVERAEVRLTRGGASSKSGKPQRRVQVMMIGVSSTGDGNGEETSTMTFGQERVLTDEDGIAEFKDVPIGKYTLKVESRRFSPAEKGGVSVVELQLTDCGTIELSGAGQIRGVVKDAAGKPTMAMVEHRLLGAADWSQGEMAMRGNYRLTGLAAGSYEVRARAVGPNPGDPSEPQVVKVEVGKTEVANLSVK